jgi:CDP-glucose 4,6-dehydratase
MNPGFWKAKPVFLTGHTGFKGAWLSEWLLQLEAKVTGYSLEPPTTPSLFEQLELQKRMSSIKGDVRDQALLRDSMAASKPAIIIHMAAQSLVRRSYTEPFETYSTNVMGTLNVLEAARSVPSVKAIIVVTTDKCYENRETHDAYRETEPLGGFDPYSSSKACAEIVTASYRQSFFSDSDVQVATARAGNVIGGGDWAKDRLVPDLVRSWSKGHPAIVRSPGAIRPWQHVLEPLHGYLELAEHLSLSHDFSEAWNFGPDESDHETVASVVTRAAGAWGAGAKWSAQENGGPHEAGLLKLDSTKARKRLGWRPMWGLEKGLAATVEWYRTQSRGGDMGQVTREQLADFMRSAKLAERASA